MKYFIFSLSLLLATITIQAQSFDTYFENKTLRLDYIFSGNSSEQHIALDQMSELPQWTGRHNNLSKILRVGNGQIRMYDAQSGECIYNEAFSTLFQEWLTTPEAQHLDRSFENTFLVPYPKHKATVEITLRNKEGLYMRKISHTIDPSDILIRVQDVNPTPPYTFLHQGGDVSKSINIAILAEGYTRAEMPKFRRDAATACKEILSYAPFNKLQDKFNFIAVETASQDSGVSVPHNKAWKNTAFGSHFDTFYSERYLTTTRVKHIHDAIAGVPYSHIIILANTDVYGGGGIFNAYTLTTTGHKDFKPVVVHEFGHSFAGLADEYYYDSDVLDNTYSRKIEPWEANITTLVKFEDKWKDMLTPSTPIPTPTDEADKYKIGVYEGAGYKSKGIYRGATDCRMKTNTANEFCPVCQRAIEQLINFYTE